MTFPWEQLPAVPEPVRIPLPVPSTDETVALLQRDIAYIVTHTAVLVRSNRPEFHNLANVPRGQIMPRGDCRFSDGTTLEFQDIGMPQPGTPEMTVKDLMAWAWDVARGLGLELTP